MKSKIAGLSAVFAIVAVLALTAGCSSSSSSNSSNTIRIGLEAPITGSLAELGQGMLNGAKQAATYVNANGGVGGKKIEIVAIDDKGDPDAGVAAANSAVKAGLDAIGRAGGTSAAALKSALAGTSGWKGWTGTVAFEPTTGNRVPAPVTVNTVTSAGAFQVDPAWITATGFTF